MPEKRPSQGCEENDEKMPKRRKDGAASTAHWANEELDVGVEDQFEEALEEQLGDDIGTHSVEGAAQSDGDESFSEPNPKRKKTDKKSSNAIVEAQGPSDMDTSLVAMAATLEAFRRETRDLRLEVDMVRVQREQQREWNKAAMAYQESKFKEEIDHLRNQLIGQDEHREMVRLLRVQAGALEDEVELIRKQLRGQEEQRNELETLKAEFAEFKACIAGTQAKGSAVTQSTTHLDPSTHNKSNTSTQRTSKDIFCKDEPHEGEPQISSSQANMFPEIKAWIESLQKFWDLKIPQISKGAYSDSRTTLDRHMRSVQHYIRLFEIDHPRLGVETFELIALARKHLYQLMVKEYAVLQECETLRQRMEFWKQLDEHATLVLQGLGWKHSHAKSALDVITEQHRWLLQNWPLTYTSDISWFPRTAVGLEKCIKRQQGI